MSAEFKDLDFQKMDLGGLKKGDLIPPKVFISCCMRLDDLVLVHMKHEEELSRLHVNGGMSYRITQI